MGIPISVLMTVYNGGRFLEKSIKSVLSQAFDQFEFVIVDDCSSDGSVALIKSYADPRIVLFENKVNQGQTKSLNIGLNQAKGRYIARMDADDMAFPDWLEKLYDYAGKNAEYSVVSCQALIIDGNDKPQFVTTAPVSYPQVVLKNLMESSINHVGSLMLREHVLAVGGYDDQYKIVADYDLWTKMLIGKYKLVNTDMVLTLIREHQVSATWRGKDTRDAEILKVMQKNLDHFTNSSLIKDELRVLWNILHDIRNCSEESGCADKYIGNIYDAVKSEFGFSSSLVQEIKTAKQEEIFKKRMFVLLSNGKAACARVALKERMGRNGWFNLLGLVFLLSFFTVFNKNIVFLFSAISRWGMRFKLNKIMHRKTGPLEMAG